ncbi:cupredoxin domain-containing protein [Rhodanobacter umsongensis]|uniref:Cupredoxin domain-containing protein n=1 Tax=Rhodanobacter umsongensis TaxID=633153 RepID=A0ABW0JHX0_9GAMM
MQRLFIILSLLLLNGIALADELPQYTLVIRNHIYQPAELKVPADAKFKLIIENQDASPEEFESTEFSREKIVLPKSTVSIFVGPLKPGSYRFFGDFHQDTAQGRLIAE